MRNFIDQVGKSIPNTLKVAQHNEIITDMYSLVLYGYYEDTGFRRFFKKIKQGIKARTNG